MLFATVEVEISGVDEHSVARPRSVHAISQLLEVNDPAFRFWVPNFSGNESKSGNGVFSGCVGRVFLSANAGKGPFLKRVAHPAYLAVAAEAAALAWNAGEAEWLQTAIETSADVRRQLGLWTMLSADEKAEIEADQRSIETVLSGSIDRLKRWALERQVSALGFSDSLGRPNPSATQTKQLIEEDLLHKRLEFVGDSRHSIEARLDWVRFCAARSGLESSTLFNFFEPRQLLSRSDVEQFYELGRDVLNPLSQLVCHICMEIDHGGGMIRDPVVVDGIKRAFNLHRLYDFLLYDIRRLMHLTHQRMAADHGTLAATFGPKMEVLRRLLKNLIQGGAYERLRLRLLNIVQEILIAIQANDWQQVKRLAQRFNDLLIYRTTDRNVLPQRWYAHLPPGSAPIEVERRYNLILEQEVRDRHPELPPRPDNPFEIFR